MTTSSPVDIPVLVVDDDTFNRDGIRLYLSNHGFTVHEAGDQAAALDMAQRHMPTAAVVDIVIPLKANTRANIERSAGIQLVRRLKELNPQMGVVVFSAHEDRGNEIWELVRDGMRGIAYLFKGIRPERLLEALHETVIGYVILDGISAESRPGLTQEIMNRLSSAERPWVNRAVALLSTLSEREREVAVRLAFSQTNMGIAAGLGISPRTVENHVSHVYDKLGFSEMDLREPGLRKSSLLAKAYMIYDLAQVDAGEH